MRYFENISLICISKRQILYTYFIDERNVSRKKKRTFREKYASKRNELIEKNNMKLCLYSYLFLRYSSSSSEELLSITRLGILYFIRNDSQLKCFL